MDLFAYTALSRRRVRAGVSGLGLCLALLLNGSKAQAANPPAPAPRLSGMWVWAADAFATSEAQTKLLDFCREQHFNHLDVHINMAHEGEQCRPLQPVELTQLLQRAADAKVTVCALRGSQRMFSQENSARTLQELASLLRFNSGLPARARLAGIKYDVEPQTLPQWRQGGAAREKLMREYLECLAQIRHVLDCGTSSGAKFQLAVDIPFWWDKEELKIEFQGRRQRFSQHIQDLTDSVTLMSYRRDPALVKQLVETERAYAAQTGKTVLPALLHSKAASPDEGFLSFYGLPTTEYVRVRTELEHWAAAEPGLGGVMHHHYGSLSNSLGVNDTVQVGLKAAGR